MPHETTGILQMEYNDTWGSVCHTATWANTPLANITCGMMFGFSSYGSLEQLPINDRPLNISTDAWEVNIVYCSGEESTLWDCDLASDKSDWLTYSEFGSGGCNSLLKISCKVNTTLPDLTYCPPTTTTTNPITSTHYTEESPGNEPSANAGLSRGK
ncbi:uncharacterized protein [Branchiostoma lanceolatum]|uniref:uncharacterized protein n=1 Tax=Branchiostoma lanceolatum TaxID=7740 RepID=UPI0034529E50